MFEDIIEYINLLVVPRYSFLVECLNITYRVSDNGYLSAEERDIAIIFYSNELYSNVRDI